MSRVLNELKRMPHPQVVAARRRELVRRAVKEGHTLREIADTLGISTQRVHQMVKEDQ